MYLTVTKANEGIPCGMYEAIFKGIEEVVFDGNTKLKWIFEITDGEHKGRKVSRITRIDPTLHAENACSQMIAGLMGKPVTDGLQFNPPDYIGKLYTIVVGEGPKKGIRVNKVLPPQT